MIMFQRDPDPGEDVTVTDWQGHKLQANTEQVFAWCNLCQGNYLVHELLRGECNMAFQKIEGEIFRFEKVGDELVGTLRATAPGDYKNKKYKIEKEDGKVVTIFGTAVLDDRMESVKEGDKVKIVLVSEEPPKVKGYNPTRIFEVYVDR